MTRSASGYRLVFTVAVLCVQLGCASATGYRVGFNGDQTGYRPEATPSIYVLPNSWSMERTVDIRVRRTIEGALRQMGYPLTTAEKADVYVLLEAWIDSTEIVRTNPGISPQSVTIFQGPDGKGRRVNIPQSILSYPVAIPAVLPRMVMVAIDAGQYRNSNEARILWRGDTIVPQREMQLEKAVPYLMIPLITSFGTKSKGVTFINVSSKQAMDFK